MILSVSWMNTINPIKADTCNDLLTECSVLVEHQQDVIKSKNKVIIEQEKFTKELEERNIDLQNRADITTGSTIGVSSLLLLLLIL